jgi:hypothetical protein
MFTSLAVGILLNGFDLGVEILFVALAMRRDGTRYLDAVNFLPRHPSQDEFGMAKTVVDQFAEILAAAGVKTGLWHCRRHPERVERRDPMGGACRLLRVFRPACSPVTFSLIRYGSSCLITTGSRDAAIRPHTYGQGHRSRDPEGE